MDSSSSIPEFLPQCPANPPQRANRFDTLNCGIQGPGGYNVWSRTQRDVGRCGTADRGWTREPKSFLTCRAFPVFFTGNRYRFGAHIRFGGNVTDDREYMVDFGSDTVGVFTWSDSHGSNFKFDGYERFEQSSPVVQNVQRPSVLEFIKERILWRIFGGGVGSL